MTKKRRSYQRKDDSLAVTWTRVRNPLKRRVTAIAQNIRSMLNTVDTDALTPTELVQLKRAHVQLRNVLAAWSAENASSKRIFIRERSKQ